MTDEQPRTASHTPMADLRHRRLGSALVGLQFLLLAVLVLPALPTFLRGEAPWPAWTLGLAGLGLGLWAVASNRPGNFNIRPTPREGGRLIDSGPYRWIRHPMYSALLLLAAGCVWPMASLLAWLALVALAGVLSTKAAFEERWMMVVHPGYAAYRAGTRRFVPWLL